MMALSAFSYSNIFFMFQNLFLSLSNAETLYYFYYFFEKSVPQWHDFFKKNNKNNTEFLGAEIVKETC